MSLSKAQQREAYRRMLRMREFEEEGIRLFKAGKIPGAFHASIGQEPARVGACMALGDDDAMTGTHWSHGHPIGRGADLKAPMAELMRKAADICKGPGRCTWRITAWESSASQRSSEVEFPGRQAAV